MKKTKIIMLGVAVLFLNNIVTASTPYNNKTALSIGVDYADGTSGVDQATNSYDTYTSMGLTTKKITNTTGTNVQGKHSNGTKYLESGIIYLVGHSEYAGMTFINNVRITSSTYNIDTDTKHIFGIRSYDNTKTSMITFAGCNTAQAGEDHLALLTYGSGTKITMGWTTDLNIASYKNWNKRFNEKIKDKSTSALSAAESASNHIYLSNTVKNYRLYGKFNKNPWYFLNTKSTDNLISNERISSIKINENTDGIVKNYNENIQEIDSYLMNEIGNINLNDYKLEINGVHKTYYDYVLYINGVRTNLGYTIVKDNTTNELTLYNNAPEDKIQTAKRIITNSNINTLTFEKSIEQKIKKYYNEYKINNVDDIIYYDSDNEKMYVVKEFKATSSDGNYILTNIMEEVN